MSHISLRKIRRERRKSKIINKVFDFLFDIAWEMNLKERANGVLQDSAGQNTVDEGKPFDVELLKVYG